MLEMRIGQGVEVQGFLLDLAGSFHFLIAQSSAEKNDGFVKNPISALRFIPLSLRRTGSTPPSTRFARLELGLFTKPSAMITF
jgi:hypothetical protein